MTDVFEEVEEQLRADRYKALALRALAAPALRARMEEAGFRVAGRGQEAFGARIREETARWAEVVRATGFRAIE